MRTARVWSRVHLALELALLWLWGIALTATAALAPMVWGRSGARDVALGGAAAALVAGFVIWGGRRHLAADSPGARTGAAL